MSRANRISEPKGTAVEGLPLEAYVSCCLEDTSPIVRQDALDVSSDTEIPSCVAMRHHWKGWMVGINVTEWAATGPTH